MSSSSFALASVRCSFTWRLRFRVFVVSSLPFVWCCRCYVRPSQHITHIARNRIRARCGRDDFLRPRVHNSGIRHKKGLLSGGVSDVCAFACVDKQCMHIIRNPNIGYCSAAAQWDGTLTARLTLDTLTNANECKTNAHTTGNLHTYGQKLTGLRAIRSHTDGRIWAT